MKIIKLSTIIALIGIFLISCEMPLEFTPKKETFVVITIDDAPNFPEVTAGILDVLGKYDARSTFFCIGEAMERETGLTNRISREHTLANHTYSHYNVKTIEGLYPDQYEIILQKEIWDVQDYIDSVNTQNVRPINNYFRPPGGQIGTKSKYIIESQDRNEVIMWDISPEDWNPEVTEDWIYYHVTSELENYEIPIILLHPGVNTVKALERILIYFKENNITVISLEDRKNKLYYEK